MNKIVFALSALFLLAGFSSQHPDKKNREPDFISIQNRWVDSVFKKLSKEERLAQLFMVAAYSNKDEKHVQKIEELITKYHIGGLIWMQGSPSRQVPLANRYQNLSKVPLLYSIDGEWGLAMRLDSTPRYPKQMTLGAIQNDSLIYYMGRQIARECKRLNIHVNFAPVADVNNNPQNPVIGMRSFGENKLKVAQKSLMYMNGMQDEHVMANGKHFPGHGDTDSDSHKKLPYISHSRKRLDTLELYPFRYLFDNGLASIMVAHLNIPSLDTTKNLASTLSPKVVNELLKTQMNFKGLIFTDALNMKGVADYYPDGIVDVKALLAGNDVLLFSGDVPKAMEEIKKAIKQEKITQEEIDERCKKILKAKFWCGLNRNQITDTKNLYEQLNTKESEILNDKLAAASITLLKNENKFLPLKKVSNSKIVEISFGEENENEFFSILKNYENAEHIGLAHKADTASISNAFEKIKSADVVFIQVNKTTLKAENNYGVGTQTLRLLDSISKMKPTALILFSNPYLLNKISSLENFKSVVMAYEYMPSLVKASANAVLGITAMNGKLPVSTNHFKAGTGISTHTLISRFPEKEKIQQQKFAQIDSIALSGITAKVYPGCQIVAMQYGEVIYQKSFGHFTYDKKAQEVTNGTLYDLASITKIASSALALMKLQEEDKFDYKKTLGYYLPYLKGTNKENLLIEDVLAHRAGLKAWIPFYLSTVDKKGKYQKDIYSKTKEEMYSVEVAKHLYVLNSYRDTIFQKIIASKVDSSGKYVYSDLGFYFLQQIIEQQSGKKQSDFVYDMYRKVGLGLTYSPLTFLSHTQIAPTEDDKIFRKQVLQGYVHDPGAALMGGVAGHAGLFGNALDVAKIMQLYLNKGELNGVRILDSNIVKDYTSYHFYPNNRRGLCFDKPEPDAKKINPVPGECSPESFGHSGFTGTYAWVDPKNNLVVVFLCNRIYPDVEPTNKLSKSDIRGKIHKAFYEAVK